MVKITEATIYANSLASSGIATSTQNHQKELSGSNRVFIRQGGRPSQYLLGGRTFQIRDCSPADIANIALRDEEEPFYNAFYFRRRSIADFDRPDYPLGFCLSRTAPEDPRILEVSYTYVKADQRGNGLGLAQTVDTLLHALEVERLKILRAQVIKGVSVFYDSLKGISFSEEAEEGKSYKIELEDKQKARKIINERLREIGIHIL